MSVDDVMLKSLSVTMPSESLIPEAKMSAESEVVKVASPHFSLSRVTAGRKLVSSASICIFFPFPVSPAPRCPSAVRLMLGSSIDTLPVMLSFAYVPSMSILLYV